MAIVALAAACTSNPKVSTQRVGPGRWHVDVVRCSVDGAPAAALADVDRVAARRCPGGHALDGQTSESAWLGNAVRGECPAIRVRAQVVCKGDAR
ncbi:hypothetical protein [Luteimonas sp. FCS-9]|uniref:hypothetical protein n=1 Tax=Luteimonas sp. FCS-9 TaxID=1547516 RepID=UPI0012E06CCA|nr:hypothetical protein [Luteimonas sp. FCS-9]